MIWIGDRLSVGTKCVTTKYTRTLPDDVVLSVRGVSKKFCKRLRRSMFYGIQDLSCNLVGIRKDRSTARRDEFWALDDINFDLKKGECLGLIGPNGCGKTTLLRILTGIFPPDKGELGVRGRVGALIALGAGFHPHMTGKENVFLNASILGMSHAEIASKFASIVDFAEIDEFIDAPVSTYSSGMRVRLGFAIAIHINPDLLLVDEVLAVGDMGFRAKCYNAMAEVAKNAAVIFVSHNMTHISRISSSCLLLNHGKIHFAGATNKAILEYQRFFEKDDNPVRAGSGEARVETMEIVGCTGDGEKIECRTGDPMHIHLKISSTIDIPKATINVGFSTLGGDLVAECSNYVYPNKVSLMAGKSVSVDMHLDALALNPGLYVIGVILMSEDMVVHYDWRGRVYTLEVNGPQIATASHQIQAKWDVTEVA